MYPVSRCPQKSRLKKVLLSKYAEINYNRSQLFTNLVVLRKGIDKNDSMDHESALRTAGGGNTTRRTHTIRPRGCIAAIHKNTAGAAGA